MPDEQKLSMANKMLSQALRKEEQGDMAGADNWLEKAAAKEKEAFAQD